MNKVKKVTKKLDQGIKGGLSVKIRVFGHFLRNSSLKVSNFLHDGRRQWDTTSEGGAIFGKNLNPGLIRGLSRDEALLGSF